MPELTRAMGINRPSLYAAFGKKEQLFRRVLDRYASNAATFIETALQKPTAREMIEQIFRGAVQFLSARSHPRGCLLMQSTPACGDASDSVRRQIVARRLAGETAIGNRLQQAQSQGDLPRHARPADLARFVMALVHGMSIQAANGATRPQLQTLAQMAIRACGQVISTSTPDRDATRSPTQTTVS
jgi:AcrR family transcriptional regulator